MTINYECLPCLVNQVVRVAEMTNARNRDMLFRKVFAYLAEVDFEKSNPEIIGETFRLLKEHIENDDPYGETRKYYNQLFLNMFDTFENEINSARNPFEQAIKYAIIGNVIDFNPIHNYTIEDITKQFLDIDTLSLTINDTEKMISDLASAKSLLYLGDNCGEVCLDKLLLKKIKEYNPAIEIFFGVRGASVVNDITEEDAYFVGIDEFSKIISNGDDSLGTVLSRTSAEFNQVYENADIIIAKGQANYESLSEEEGKQLYFLLVSKCEVIAKHIGVAQRSLICMKRRNNRELLSSLDKLHTTDLGVIRIKKNLSLDVYNVVDWCREKIQSKNAKIIRKGKNWYIEIDGCQITVNAYSYTIITAHRTRSGTVKH